MPETLSDVLVYAQQILAEYPAITVSIIIILVGSVLAVVVNAVKQAQGKADQSYYDHAEFDYDAPDFPLGEPEDYLDPGDLSTYDGTSFGEE